MKIEGGFFRRPAAAELPRVECEPNGGETHALRPSAAAGGGGGLALVSAVSLTDWRRSRTEVVCGTAIVMEALHAGRFHVMMEVSARRGTLYPHLFDSVTAVEFCGVRYRREHSLTDKAGPGTDGTGRYAVDVTVVRTFDQPLPRERYVPSTEEPEPVRLIFTE